MASSEDPAAAVGVGATILYWTDRVAGTVVSVSRNGREIVVQEDTAIRTDPNGMSDAQSYRYEANPDGITRTFTLRRNGRWILKGESLRGTAAKLGFRRHYHDYSF
jgi:hypothetical protein